VKDAKQPGVEALRKHAANGYGLLRLFLASLVILQHSLYLTGHEASIYVGFAEIARRASYGDLAVGGFFALSGFLLQTSVDRNPPRRFLRLRFFRLLPGFWATLAVVAFVLAPLIAWQAGTWQGYRLTGADSAVTYLLHNAGLLVTQPSIGGVLARHPYPDALDGSLWTLLPEFTCYLTLLAVTVLGRRVGMAGWIPPAVVGAGGLLVFWFATAVLPGDSGLFISGLGSLIGAFFAGSLVGALGWSRLATPRNTVGIAIVTAMVLGFGLWLPLGPVLLALLVVFVGAVLRDGWPSRVGTKRDLSYGVYLYHFPVIQLLVAAGLAGASVAEDVLVLSPIALLLTLPLAAASWHFVEAPAQRFGRRRRTNADAPEQRAT
jgi:peptidoglycan/LPS O-acetylase OafA/YrhL